MQIRRDGDHVVVTNLWGFRTRFPVSSIESVDDIGKTGLVAGIGAHGWRGHWTVNTRRSPAIRVTLREPARGHLLGIPVRVRVLDLAPATPADVA